MHDIVWRRRETAKVKMCHEWDVRLDKSASAQNRLIGKTRMRDRSLRVRLKPRIGGCGVEDLADSDGLGQ